MFLLDTNVVSEAMRPSPRERIVQKIHRHENQIAIASVVWHELWYGVGLLPRSHRRDDFEKYLNGFVAMFKLIDYDRVAAEWHARERVRLAVQGQMPPFLDGQIAAVAAVHDLTLVTFNTVHFNRFAGLRVESWW
ncbi:MAG TPA: type II toxin-antitoxin system VapC family toxin [Thermoanaerobaculia bacterium]|nr:type II toxin-antitoxin system VapC family toxin [Thermoanaerobaculia bacterium]